MQLTYSTNQNRDRTVGTFLGSFYLSKKNRFWLLYPLLFSISLTFPSILSRFGSNIISYITHFFTSNFPSILAILILISFSLFFIYSSASSCFFDFERYSHTSPFCFSGFLSGVLIWLLISHFRLLFNFTLGRPTVLSSNIKG